MSAMDKLEFLRSSAALSRRYFRIYWEAEMPVSFSSGDTAASGTKKPQQQARLSKKIHFGDSFRSPNRHGEGNWFFGVAYRKGLVKNRIIFFTLRFIEGPERRGASLTDPAYESFRCLFSFSRQIAFSTYIST